MAIDKELLDKLEKIKNPKMFSSGAGSALASGARTYKQIEGDKEKQKNPSVAQATLDKTRMNAAQRILSDPIAAKKNPEWLIKDLERIASGGEPEKAGGIQGLFGKALGGALEGVSYVMGRPLAVVASGLKEISDIPSGGASITDFLGQAVAKDTAVSKYLPKTGTKWLDQTLGFVADIALDPLTYVTFGATQWAGREGRLALAAEASKADNIAKVPSLLAKVEDGSIARLGEWALNAEERAALGIRRGVSWSFGSGNTIGKEGTLLGKISEKAATPIGGGFARGRALLGDTALAKPFQKLTAKQYEKAADLTMYGRRAVEDPDTIKILTDLASYRSAIRANGTGRMLGSRVAKEGERLASDVAKYENQTGRKLHEVIENIRPAADAQEQLLADRKRQFFNMSANTSNEVTADFGVRRGTSPYIIKPSPNYVPHLFTEEAAKKLASSGGENATQISAIRRALNMGQKDFTAGPTVLMKRELQTGKKFLGSVLKSNNGDGYATIREINDITMKKLKFNLFEEDSAKYISGYINQLVNQAKRVSYTDSLFDYGPSVVRSLNDKIVPNRAVAKQLNETLDFYDEIVTPILDELAKTTKGVLGPRLALAEAVSSSQPGAKILSKKQVDGVRKVLNQTIESLNSADKSVLKLDLSTREAYENVAKPLRSRLDDIQRALDSGDETKLVSDLGLRDLYKRMFPDGDVPDNPKALAEDIIDAARDLFSPQTNRKAADILGSALPGVEKNVAGTKTAKITKLQSELEQLAATKPNAVRKIAEAETKVAEATAKLDPSETLRLSREEWDSTVGKMYSDDISKVMSDISANPPKGAAAEITQQWVTKTNDLLNSLDSPGLALNPVERDLMRNVMRQMKGLEAQIALLDSQDALTQRVVNSAINKKSIQKAAKTTIKGWENIESLGVRLPEEIRDRLFGKMEELATPGGADAFWKKYFMYDKFFKVGAMYTPGFIVRNSYTAAWNNFVFGTSVADVGRGIRFATSVMRKGVDEALANVPAKDQGLYKRALEIAYASGAGQTADDIIGPIMSSRAKKILQTKVVGSWSKANEGVELAARFSMGLSALKRGMTFDSAVQNIGRYHFDYSNLSSLDEFMKKFIPFWTFASRNVPLQLVNQVARPKMYRIYESAQRNFPVEDDSQFPKWLRDRGPIQLPFMGKDTVLNMDLPHVDMEEQIRMFSDPIRLLSQANPLFKLPIELAGERQLWSNAPFKNEAVDVRGPLDYPTYALGALAGLLPFAGPQSWKNPRTGGYQTSSKAAYAVPNLIPPLATLQRILPELGGKESYQDRASSNRASFVGLPFRRVSEQEKFNELTRRQFEIKDYLSDLTKRGKLMPKES